MKHLAPFAAAVVWLVVCPISYAQDKSPVPDEASWIEASKLLAPRLGAICSAAKTTSERAELAKRLLVMGQNATDNGAVRYILLDLALKYSSQAGDLLTATTVAGVIATHYEVDELSLEARVLHGVVQAYCTPEEHRQITIRLQQAIAAAIAKDRFVSAKGLNELAVDSARQARLPDLLAEIKAYRIEIKALETEFNEFRYALARLKESPTDPAANLRVGAYQCFFKGDWNNGIRALALGNDDKLKLIAASELTTERKALDLGHAWWDYSETAQGQAKAAARRRAADWYQQALPELQGVSQQQVESRLLEASAVKK